MASRVNICSVNMLDNPGKYLDKFKLEITFEVFEYLPKDLEWELVYVGSGASREYDQVLDSVVVGPVPEGRHKFVFDAPPPNSSKIPDEDVVGVSVLLLRCKYDDQEFINLGWFVSNDYAEDELKETPPAKPLVDKLLRTVQTDDLRVTTFAIKWGEQEEYPQEQEGEPTEVVNEAELMPVNDDEDPEEEESDEEDDNNEEGEVDLNESLEKANERIAAAIDAMDVDETQEKTAEGVEKADAEKQDEPMDEEMAVVNDEMASGDAVPSVQSKLEPTGAEPTQPLVDRTNGGHD